MRLCKAHSNIRQIPQMNEREERLRSGSKLLKLKEKQHEDWEIKLRKFFRI